MPIRWLLIATIALVLSACLPQEGHPTSAAGVPSGTIVAFAGEQLPEGWSLCDGSQTASGLMTPDLRGRFIMGSDVWGVGTRGGSASHNHEASSGESTGNRAGVDKDNNLYLPVRAHQHDITVAEGDHLPPYVSLVYIMKN